MEVVATLTSDGDDPVQQLCILSDGRAVTGRRLTVTTIGVPLRAELRLKSLLTVMRSRTLDEWSFTEEGPVDLAICDPASALTRLAVKRAATDGPRRVVSLICGEQAPLADTLTLRDPVGVSDFLTLLDSVSSSIRGGSSLVSTGPAGAAPDVFRFAVALRAAVRNASRDVFRVQSADIELHVIPATRQVLLAQPLDDTVLARLMAPVLSVDVRQLHETHAAELIAAGTEAHSADVLLWKLGLRVPHDQLHPDLSADGLFSLRRWPDFGRLPHRSEHLRLAARLARQEMSLADLGAQSGVEAAQIRPFINACALCDLLNAKPGRTTASAAAARLSHRSAPVSRYQMLFQTIRSALRLGAR